MWADVGPLAITAVLLEFVVRTAIFPVTPFAICPNFTVLTSAVTTCAKTPAIQARVSQSLVFAD